MSLGFKVINRFRKGLGLFAGSALFLCVAGAASAASVTLFEDTFDRGSSNTVGNGWTEYGRNDSAVKIDDWDNLVLNDVQNTVPSAAARSSTIDATGYDSLLLSVGWKANKNTEDKDLFRVSWSDTLTAPADDKNAPWQIALKGSGAEAGVWQTTTVSLDPAAGSAFKLLLWTMVSGRDEGFVVDYVRVTGTVTDLVPDDSLVAQSLDGDGLGARSFAGAQEPEPATVPVPAAGLLLLGGLGVLPMLRRRRKHTA